MTRCVQFFIALCFITVGGSALAQGGADCIVQVEKCNDLDDDCDGRVDEDFDLGGMCTDGVGACAADGQRCCAPDGNGTVCKTGPLGVPSPEICNGIDDDCDVTIDEEVDCGGCIPRPETCNMIDDDCDGQIDEDFANLGEICRDGAGQCAVDGILVCNLGGDGTICKGHDHGDPSPEICNGLDDDCDNSIDESIDCDGPCIPVPEICNGADEDCDGRVDEDQPGGRFCQFCNPAAEVCNDFDDDCDTIVDEGCAPCLPRPETCNYIDEDCDGILDEDFPNLGEVCRDGVGQCAVDGVLVCNLEGNGTICKGHDHGDPSPELCNGLDDDCDNSIDEGIDCDGPCVPVPEICNGADEDCDGLVDEDQPNGRFCQFCNPVAEVCNDFDDDCDTIVDEGCAPCLPRPEVCNYIDEDCDGILDEDFQDLGNVCRDGQGQCAVDGEIVCNLAGDGTICKAHDFGEPSPEVCNRLDDDCDGSIDEGVDCDGPCVPVLEICNVVDDDCDGQIDEGYGLGSPCMEGVGACRVNGEIACSPDGGVSCITPIQPVPIAELCNAIDDDCDGQVDEDFIIGSICAAGVGECRTNGQTACGPAGDLICTAIPSAPNGELCNDLDDDCDGNIDEGFGLGLVCFEGQGLCRQRGVLVCSPDGAANCDAQPGDPVGEICNTLDDDCDGMTDEQFGVNEICMVGVGECRRQGRQACNPDGGADCNVVPGIPVEELCNDLDDDCDGIVDEGPRNCHCVPAIEICNGMDDDCDNLIDEGIQVGAPCSVGVGACGRDGELVCTPNGNTTCSATPGDGRAEACNGIDDDCDGNTDERYPLGEACQEGIGACGAAGVYICENDIAVCTAEPGDARAEECNGIDDDCDGDADEGFELGADCLEGIGACTRNGVRICLPDGRTGCSVLPGDPRAETCNGIDDDCDGNFDEDFLLGQGCAQGVGACARNGITVCSVDGGITCDAQPGDPRVEQCNGVDDDCDDTIDEGVINACGNCGLVPDEICNDRDDDCDTIIDEMCAVGPGCLTFNGECLNNCPAGLSCDQACGECVSPCAPGADNICADNCENGEVCDEDCNGCVPACDRRVDRCIDSCPTGQQCDEDCGGCEEIPCRIDGVICADLCPDGTGCDEDCGTCVPHCQAQGNQCLDNCPNGLTCDQNCGDCVQPCDRNANGICVDNCPQGERCGLDCGACEPAPSCQRQGPDQCLDNCPDGQQCDNNCQACVEAQDCQVVGGDICNDQCPPSQVCNEDCDTCMPTCALEQDGTCKDRCPDGTVCDQNCGACIMECFQRGDVCVDNCPDGQQCSDECGGCVAEPVCIVSDEICDGLDNDCDTQIDEGFPVGQPCDGGVGQCGFRGVFECALDGQIQCHGQPGDMRPEVCNAADDDCDGSVDENLGVGDLCTVGAGSCVGHGRLICDGNEGTTCNAEPGDPVAERCDNLDNDCDGQIDENVGNPCVVGQGSCSQAGVLACDRDGNLICTGEAGDPIPESCNALDDDCDGRIDEGYNVGQPCFGDACDGNGHVICDGQGDAMCDAPPGDGQVETCDGADNDCDGRIDETGDCCQAGDQRACGVGIGVCFVALQRCTDAFTWADCPGLRPQGDELCDTLDNDCDNNVDEDFPSVGQICDNPIANCGQGQLICANDGLGLVCDAQGDDDPAEVCDRIDNDCDGEVDENVQNACGTCERDCLGDRIDNDCDGLIDEINGPIAFCQPGGGPERIGNRPFRANNNKSNDGGCTASDSNQLPLWAFLLIPVLLLRRRR